MAVKVMQLESLLSSKQADLQQMGLTEQTWLQDAQSLRDAVASTLDALGNPPLLVIALPDTCLCWSHFRLMIVRAQNHAQTCHVWHIG